MGGQLVIRRLCFHGFQYTMLHVERQQRLVPEPSQYCQDMGHPLADAGLPVLIMASAMMR